MVLVQACAYTIWSQFHWLVPRPFLFLFPSYECQALWLPTSNGSGIAGRPTNMHQQGKVVPSMVITTNTCTHSRAQNQPLFPIAQAKVSEPQTFAQKFRQQFPCHHVPWWMDWACRRVRHGALQQLLQLKPANFGNFRDQAPSKRVGRRQPRHAQLKWRNCKAWKKLNDPQPSVSLVYCRLYIIMMCTIVYTYIDYIVITLHAHLLYVSHRRPQNNQAITLHASSNGDFSASHKTSTYAMFSQQSPFLERASSAYAMAQKIMDCSWFFNLSAKRPILQHYLCNFVGHHHSSSTTFGPKSANII